MPQSTITYIYIVAAICTILYTVYIFICAICNLIKWVVGRNSKKSVKAFEKVKQNKSHKFEMHFNNQSMNFNIKITNTRKV